MQRRTVLGATAAAVGLTVVGCDSSSNTPAGRANTVAGPTSTPPTATLGQLPREVTNGPRNRPNVALTFHGQGDPVLVRRLLTELERGGSRVTVLAVGAWLTAEPDMARRILDGGHELGNHTQNHRAIADMTAAQAFAEINACAQTLMRLTQSIGIWFRPSQTVHSTPTIQSEAGRVGYATCLSYDLDSLDYTDPGPDRVLHNILSAVRNGSIVSMHFGHPDTVAATPALLDGLRQRGLHSVTMTELMSR